MDVIERLRNLLRASSWVRDPALALRLIPEIAVDLPPVVEIVTTGGASERGVPTRAVEALALPVARVLLPLAEAAIDGKPREDLQKQGMDRLLADPLLPEVASLLAQSASPRLRAVAVPALAVAWASGRLLGPGWPELKEQDGALAAKATSVSRRLGELPPAQRAKALLDVAWGLRARLAAAATLVGAAGFSAATGGLYRRVMADPLVFLFARGTLDVELPVSLVAAVLGVPIEEEMASSLEKAASVALSGLAERRQKSKTTPMDEALLGGLPPDLPVSPASARAVLLDPWAGPLLIAGLPELADSKALSKLGVGKNAISAFGRRDATRALAASWRDLSGALLAWDVLSALVSRLVPVRQDGPRYVVPGGALPPQARWELLVPRRLRPPITGAVVAVRLGRVRAAAAKTADERGSPLLTGVADGVWGRLIAATPEGVFETAGDHGIGVFTSPLMALQFAIRAQRELSGPTKLPVGVLGDPVDLPRGLATPVGVAVGEVLGGTDGEAAWLDGPAVAEAISLTGGGPAEADAGADPAGIRAAVFTPRGLRSSGVVVSHVTVQALIQVARARNLPLHVRERGGRAGGIEEDFVAYTMLAWYEAGEDKSVVALLAIGEADGPAEVIARDAATFGTIARNDREAGASGGFGFARAASTPQAARPAAGGFGGFGGFGPSPAQQGPGDPFGTPAGAQGAAEHPTDIRAAEPQPAAPSRPAAPPPPSRPAAPPPPSRPAAPPPVAAAAGLDALPAPAAGFSLDEDPFADMETSHTGTTPAPWAPTEREADLFALPASGAAPADGGAFADSGAFADPFAGVDGPSVSIEDDDDWGPETPAPDEEPATRSGWLSFAAGALDAAPPPPAAPAEADAFSFGDGDFNFGGGEAEPSPPEAPRPVARTENILELDVARAGFGLRSGAAAGGASRADDVVDELAAASGGAVLEAASSSGFGLVEDDSTEIADPGHLGGGWESEPETQPGSRPSGARQSLSLLDDLPGLPSATPDAALEDAVPDWDSDGLFSDAGPGFAFVDESQPLVEPPPLAVPLAEESSLDGETFPPLPDGLAADPLGEDYAGDEADEDAADGGFAFLSPDVGASLDGLPDFETGNFEIQESEEADAMHRGFDRPHPGSRPAPAPAPAPTPPPRAAPPPPRAAPPAPVVEDPRSFGTRSVSSQSSAAPPPGLPDFGYMFQGYVLHQAGKELVFGRRYGKLLVDAHAYRTTDRVAAYRSFLQEKVREGFVPRAELTRPAPPESECSPLEQRLLVDAYRAMVGG